MQIEFDCFQKPPVLPMTMMMMVTDVLVRSCCRTPLTESESVWRTFGAEQLANLDHNVIALCTMGGEENLAPNRAPSESGYWNTKAMIPIGAKNVSPPIMPFVICSWRNIVSSGSLGGIFFGFGQKERERERGEKAHKVCNIKATRRHFKHENKCCPNSMPRCSKMFADSNGTFRLQLV